MHTSVTVVLLVFVACLYQADARGAGRAFPIESENYITEQFDRINSHLEWDHTNFLVDLAGHYANCDQLGNTGTIRVDRLTPEGETITGFVDNIDGRRSDIDAVNGYIRSLVDRWTYARTYNTLIRNADRFGCSVRPGCSGKLVASCLFNRVQGEATATPEPKLEQHALAFTRQQYLVAEIHTGNRWDRSHLLENLSGYETSCEMIDRDNWPFREVRKAAAERGMRLSALFDYEPNEGSTDRALNRILANFKKIQHATALGCSIIPDCMRGSQMYVVVSCVYEEE